MPTRINPFPNPVPRSAQDINATFTRGNDNILAGAVNDLIQALQTGARDQRSVHLFDPRLAAEDADHILASRSFRHRGPN